MESRRLKLVGEHNYIVIAKTLKDKLGDWCHHLKLDEQWRSSSCPYREFRKTYRPRILDLNLPLIRIHLYIYRLLM